MGEIDEAQEGRALRNGDPKNHTPQQVCQITLADCRDSGKFTMLQCHTKYRSCLDKTDKKAEKLAAAASPERGTVRAARAGEKSSVVYVMCACLCCLHHSVIHTVRGGKK